MSLATGLCVTYFTLCMTRFLTNNAKFVFLADMGPLIFEVVCGPSLKILGHARLDDVAILSANAPIHG